jgi:hypothetical protein
MRPQKRASWCVPEWHSRSEIIFISTDFKHLEKSGGVSRTPMS